MMGNIDNPFNKDRRMNVEYLVYNNYRSFSAHRFLLIVPGETPELDDTWKLGNTSYVITLLIPECCPVLEHRPVSYHI